MLLIPGDQPPPLPPTRGVRGVRRGNEHEPQPTPKETLPLNGKGLIYTEGQFWNRRPVPIDDRTDGLDRYFEGVPLPVLSHVVEKGRKVAVSGSVLAVVSKSDLALLDKVC